MEYKEYKKMVEKRGYRVYNVHGWLLLEKKIGDIKNEIKIKTDLKSSVHISFSDYDPDVFKATLDLLGMVKDDEEEQLIEKEYNTEDLIGLDYIESQKYERGKRCRCEDYYTLEDSSGYDYFFKLAKLIETKYQEKSDTEDEKYYLRHKLLHHNNDDFGYLAYYPLSKEYWISTMESNTNRQTQFTENEIENIKVEHDVTLEDFEMIRIENEY